MILNIWLTLILQARYRSERWKGSYCRPSNEIPISSTIKHLNTQIQSWWKPVILGLISSLPCIFRQVVGWLCLVFHVDMFFFSLNFLSNDLFVNNIYFMVMWAFLFDSNMLHYILRKWTSFWHVLKRGRDCPGFQSVDYGHRLWL